MIHCAHASAYHWLQVGTPANRARSEWQCSRVHAILGHVEPALRHARRCLEIVEANPDEMEDWDLPAAYEALGARAHGRGRRRRRRAATPSSAGPRRRRSRTRTTARCIEADFATIRT